MCCRLVVAMLVFVEDRLGGRNSADPDHAEDHEYRNESLPTTNHKSQPREKWLYATRELCRESRQIVPDRLPTFLVGFAKSLLYTARTILCGRSTSPASNILMTRRHLLC